MRHRSAAAVFGTMLTWGITLVGALTILMLDTPVTAQKESAAPTAPMCCSAGKLVLSGRRCCTTSAGWNLISLDHPTTRAARSRAASARPSAEVCALRAGVRCRSSCCLWRRSVSYRVRRRSRIRARRRVTSTLPRGISSSRATTSSAAGTAMAPSFDYNPMEMTALIRRSTYRTTISCTCSTTIRIRGWGWTALQSFYASALGSHSPLLCAWAMCPGALNTFKSRSAHTMRLFCTAV